MGSRALRRNAALRRLIEAESLRPAPTIQAPEGRIPHVRLGRYRRFREETLEGWLGELEEGSTDAASQGVIRPKRGRKIGG